MTNDNECARQAGGKHRPARCANPHCPGRHCNGGAHRQDPMGPAGRWDRGMLTQTTEARVQTRG